MIKLPRTQDEKMAVARRVAEKVAATAIDAGRSPLHAARRRAEIDAQAEFLVRLYDINGWNLNALLLNTSTAIAEAEHLAALQAAAAEETVDA